MIARFFPNYTPNIPPKFEYGWFTSAKTKSLMEDRKIHLFVKQHNYNPYEEVEILKKIETLQSKIYKLDKYGERHWKLDFKKIKILWNNISNFVSNIGFTMEETVRMLTKMESYMQVEIRLRDNNLPNTISLSEYYELKMCDVHLQRLIVKSIASKKYDNNYYRIWELIDIASEILDDLNDIREDCKDYNCNRILISNQIRGTETVVQDYINYSKTLVDEFENLVVTQESNLQKIFRELFDFKINDLNNKLNNLDMKNYKSKIFEKLMKFNNNSTVQFSDLNMMLAK